MRKIRCLAQGHNSVSGDSSGFIQASMSKIQGLFKDFLRLSYSFQGLEVMKNTDLSVKFLLPKCSTEIMETLVLEN